MIRQLLKEKARVLDSLRVVGGGRRGPPFRGMRMPDGSPVPVETIMEQFGVDRARAEAIAKRQTR